MGRNADLTYRRVLQRPTFRPADGPGLRMLTTALSTGFDLRPHTSELPLYDAGPNRPAWQKEG
jgi:hypothetical protein